MPDGFDLSGFSLLSPTDFSLGDLASNYSLGASPLDVSMPQLGQGSSGWWDALQGGMQSLGGLAKAALPFAQLGTTVGGLALGIQGAQQSAHQAQIAERAMKLQQQSAERAAGAAAPLQQFGTESLARATAGQVPSPMQAQIDLWAKSAKQQARDYLARAGIADSSSAVAWEGWIDQQAEAMKMEALQAEEQLGIQSLSQAGGVLTGAGSIAAGSERAALAQGAGVAQLIAQANAELARLEGQRA